MKYRSEAIILKTFSSIFFMIKKCFLHCLEILSGTSLFKRIGKQEVFFKIIRIFLIALNQQELGEAIIVKRSLVAK